MKLTPKWLLRIIAGLGVLLVGYTVFSMITGHHLSERVEMWFYRGIIVAALAVFVYNRKVNK
jgi:uncharacterized membrane protein